MSDFLLETGRQTLMLELQEASRLPERLGEDFVRAANTIIHCEGKVIVAVWGGDRFCIEGKRGVIG